MIRYEIGCPCENCVVFAICNSKAKDNDIDSLFIIKLAIKCKLLHGFLLVRDANHGIHMQNQKIGAARYVFGARSP